VARSHAALLDRLIAINAAVCRWLAYLGAVCLFALMMLTFLDVGGRFLRKPILGATEVSALLMGFLVFFTFGHTTVRRGHLRADFIFSRLPLRTRAVLDIITHSLAVILVGFMSWRMFVFAETFRTSGRYTQTLNIYLWPDAYIIAIASLLMVTSLILQVLETARDLARGSLRAPDPIASTMGPSAGTAGREDQGGAL
jgi:TRAP-type C4-dicarboxylate transport system permease small subunit